MKKYSTIVLLGLLLSGCSAMAQSSETHKITIPAEHIVVRPYNYFQEIIFGYGAPPQASQNPSTNANMKRTTIALRTYTTGHTEQIAELPVGYKVFDAQVITLTMNESGNSVPIDFCVFCGTKIIDNGYWVFSITGNLMWVSNVDSTGFVGFFYLNSNGSNNGASNNVYLRQVRDTKHLFKMAAYAESYGFYCNYCGTTYFDNAVLDVIGVPLDTMNYASCINRIKFYPECNGSVLWSSDIRVPTGNPEEIVTDITGTDNYIFTSSIFPNDTQSVYIRRSNKDTYYHPDGVKISPTMLKLKLNNILIAPLIYNTYFKKPIRVTHLTGDYAVVSFVAANTSGSFFSCNGLFSFKVDQQSVIDGKYDNTPCTLVDVCRYKDTVASVALIETSPHNYQINTIRWSPNSSHLFSLSDTSRILQSIDTRTYSGGTQRLLAGGLIGTGPNRCWKLLDQDYFNSAFSPSCFANSTRSITSAGIATSIIAYDYEMLHSYGNDLTNFPMTIITRTNTQKSLFEICSEP